MSDVELRLLGPVEVRSETGVLVPLRRRQERLALAVLLLEPGRAVAVDRLVDLLWNQKPPPMARAALQTVMSHIRAALRSATNGDADGSVRLLARGGGYLLQVRPECVDLHRFNRMVDEARAVQDPIARSARLASALDLWRGPALGDAATGDARERLCGELEESRFAAISDRIDAELDAGRHADVVAELSSLTAEYPLRERLHGQLMVALYRCGRRAEALDAFRRARQLLVAELGLEPGPQLRALEASIIAGTARTEDLLPAATQARVVPAQLPPDLASFAGRSDDLRRLDALLAEDRTATAPSICLVTGTAGVGKTTLAVHWAQQTRERFPDGQVYLNLRGFDPVDPPAGPTETLPVLLQTLQVPAEQIPAALEAQIAFYRGLLAGRRTLIILDNVRDAEQVRPLLPGSPGCAVVITSRNQLASLLVVDGARLVPLDLLSADEARELLARRLGAERVAAEAGAVDDMIARCARLPLALAIVAARAATHPAFALAALVDEPHDRHAGLDTLDGGDHTTRLRAVFSWSYQSLSHGAAPFPTARPAPRARHRGARRGESRRHADRAGAHPAGRTGPSAPGQRERAGRYSFHDLLRAYAAELAQTHDHATERHTALHRLFDHYLHTAHTAHRLLTPHRDPVAVGVPLPEVAMERLADDAAQAPLRRGIELRDVWFRYDESLPWVLRGVDLTIPHGRSVALVGLNGAGKSTLIKLLCRFYDPTRGAILWDGVDIRRIPVDELRRRMSVLFQDFMTYDLTAAENIGIGDLDALPDRSRITAAARMAHANTIIEALPRGYDTLLSRIFFGQSDEDDEPSAGLDAQAEHRVHRQLQQHRAGRTSLLVSHRLGAVRDADLILVLGAGLILEQGTHDELIAAGGEYAHLFTVQASGYRVHREATAPAAG